MSLIKFIDKLFPSGKDRRKGNRFDTRISAALKTSDHTQMVEVLDLSEKGCGFFTNVTYFLVDGQIVEIELIYIDQLGYLFVSKEPISGVVVRPEKAAGKKIGIRFLDKINERNAIEIVINDLKGQKP